ncbi:amidohydrolase family protein [Glutamicibacter sp. MNS18]|uniref:N-acetylglucosamine-6-phosphate deacetylase n=1 Tax=Glutamicibacter sp. MNS18 TaxID=2989817 RepID=UPI0022358A29|nr:amidohydrolase family protein [Glutamicibacter sp. MNS18]MCW4465182.1 amidohydrolase family protein [Glutamicibacter sp. MNS18]
MSSPSFVIFAPLHTDGATVPDGALAVTGERIVFAGTRIAFLTRPDAAQFSEHPVPPGALLAPGLVDLHCHGAVGADFPNPMPGPVTEAIGFLHRAGTTTLLASLVTAGRPAMLQAAAVLAGFVEAGLLAGIHAEGPFLSAVRCGAQDPRHLSAPQPEFVRELAAASRGSLRTMTYAPELAGSTELVSLLVHLGVVPSLGHTDADTGQASASLEHAHARLAQHPLLPSTPTVTHLFNGMPPLHHRVPGPLAACLEQARRGRAVVELIADGVHLVPDTVRMVFALVGAGNIALVTDSMAATGLPDGRYTLGPQEVTVDGGEARLASDGSLAGGTATLLQVLRRTVAAGVGLDQALASATGVPARVLGLSDSIGSLRAGLYADVLVLDARLSLLRVFRRGRLLEPQPAATTPARTDLGT